MITISPRFLKRSLSAIVIAPVFLFLLVFSTWSFLGVLAVAFTIALYEWIGLVRKTPFPFKIIVTVLGIFYLPTSFYAFAELRLSSLWESTSFGKMMIIILLFSVWASDIGGYTMGKILQGPKLWPLVSPNKTWAGLLGAILFPFFILCFFVIGYEGIAHVFTAKGIIWIGLASILIGVAGQAGDLLISSLKRKAGIKDTGTLIPGHGGLLDRIDALMMVSILMFIIMHLTA